MNSGEKQSKKKGNSTLAIFAGCAVAFMVITTIISVIFYRRNLSAVENLLSDREYQQYNSYVIFVAEDDNSNFWNEVYTAAKNRGAKEGVCVDRISDNLKGDFSKTQLLEMAINSGCDGILLEGDDSEKTVNLIKEAVDNGIVVVTMRNDSVDSVRTSFVGTSNYNVSRLYAQKIIETIQGYVDSTHTKADVLILNGKSRTSEETISMMTGIQEAIAQADAEIPTLNFLNAEIDTKDEFAVEEYVQKLFLSDDLPNLIVCLDDSSTSSVYQAMIDYNQVGKVELLGFYQSDTILGGIEQGVIDGTVTIDTKSLGEISERAFREYHETGYVSDFFVVNNELVDINNVKEYREEHSDEK